MNRLKHHFTRLALVMAALNHFSTSTLLAGQGAQRMLYTVPNSTFIISRSGDNAVTINDASGSIATLQTLINNARTANPNAIIIIRLLNGAIYTVNGAGLVLGPQECLVGTGATLRALNSSVTNTLVTISTGATNVSVAGGTYDGNGASIYGIYAPSTAARVNIDKVTVLGCGQDCIQLNGNGTGTFDNEMTVTRCDVSGSSGHSGISIWNATQTICLENNCHNNSVGIWMGNNAYCTVANNTCESNSVGIDYASGNDNYIADNTCNNNGTGILADGSGSLIVSDATGSNTVAGINSSGSGNIYVDNLFTAGNAANFLNGGSGDKVVAYKGSLGASGQSYFYPPLIDNQHTTTIVNGMGRTDITNSATTAIDNVQSQYNAAVSANPGNVIVLHLNGNYTVGANPLSLSSDTCVLLNGTIQINSSTSASCAVTAGSGSSYISISGGTIDGGASSPPSHGREGIFFSGVSMFQIDAVTLQNFGNNTSRVGGSDVVRIDHGSTPRIVTRCTVNGGSARGIWLATGGIKNVVSDNTVTDVQMDGVDCDESTTGSLVKFNTLSSNSRYGVFIEQSASYNLVLGNVCNYDSSYGVGCYNNSSTQRGATAYNSVIGNSILGGGGLRNGSTGLSTVVSSDNFFFNNAVVNSSISSQLNGSQNYYSQNYLSGTSLSTSGTEVFFNSPDVSGNLYVQDSNSGLDAVVTNAATGNGAAVITGPATGLGNDEWQLIPTDSGYYKIVNSHSGLVMNVSGASTSPGAAIIQWPYAGSGNDEWMPVAAGNGLYNFVCRLDGLFLDVTGAGTSPGTQLDQQFFSGGTNQRFDLMDAVPPAAVVTGQSAVSWTGGGAPDGNWQNAANWGDDLPQAGDRLAFGSGPQILTTNNFPPGTVFDNVSFSAVSPAFSLSGNGFVLAGCLEDTSGILSGGTINDGSVNNQTINLPVTISGGSHVITTAGGAGQLSFNGVLTRNPGALVQFNKSGGSINTGLANANGIVGGWALSSTSSALINNNGNAGTVDWAAIGSGAVGAYGSYTTVSGNGQTIPGSAGSNVKVTSNGGTDDTVGAGTTGINTLYWTAANGGNGYVDIPAGDTLRLGAQGGIMVNTTKYFRIGNGSATGALTAGGAANTPGELSLYNLSYYSGGALEVWCYITDNGGSAYPVTVNIFGSVNIDLINTYSGGTYINTGDAYINPIGGTSGPGTFGSGPIYVYPGGRADFGGENGDMVTNSFFISGYGFLAASQPGALKGTYNGTFTGPFTLLGDAAIDPNAGSGTNTCNFTGPIAGTGNLIIGGANPGLVAGTATFGGTNSYSGDAIIDATANKNGGTGIKVATGKNNLMQNGGNLVLVGGSSGVAAFDLGGTVQTINGLIATNGTMTNAVVKSSAGNGTLVVGNNGADANFAGIIQNGGGTVALIKAGSGTQTLNGNNTYTGNTTVSAGTLALGGTGSISNSMTIIVGAGAKLDVSSRSDQTFTLGSGQALRGGGTVNVNLTIASNATVMPGDAANVGTLTVASAAQLQGTTYIKVNALAGTGDQIAAGSFTYGGTLTVTNLAGTFVAGQAFQLFQADSYAGAFSATNLPPLGNGLAWRTDALATSGILTVVATTNPPPRINNLYLSGMNLVFGATNGLAGGPCYVLSSTDLTLPLTNWQVIATNYFDTNGSFSFTNVMNANSPQNFYRLRVP